MGKSDQNLHKNRYRAIRKYVDFKIDMRKKLSPYQKRKIKRYYDEVDALTQRAFLPYKSKNRKKLRAVQEFAQHENLKLSQLNTAFVPVPLDSRAKIRFAKNGDIILETDHVKTRGIKFDLEELIQDPQGYTEKMISKYPNLRVFTPQAGRYECKQSYNRNTIGIEIANLTLKYGNEDKNNYFGNWLFGVNGHSYKNQGAFEDYKRAKLQADEKQRREKANQRKREYRARKK